VGASKYGVLTADFERSRAVEDFPAVRDRLLANLSELHAGTLLGRYTVTTWDEFQTVVRSPAALPRIIFDVRRLTRPFDLRIGIGIGPALEPIREPLNELSGGPAFELARNAIDTLKDASQRVPRRTCFRGPVAVEEPLNLIYGLHDSLLRTITESQWMTINTYLDRAGRNQEATAKLLDVEPSTVSRGLQRGCYWQMEETVQSLERLIARWLKVEA
jgi:hypothetical protein